MFDKFTESAHCVFTLAVGEAKATTHERRVGTEHLFLGLISENGGVAAQALAALGVDLLAARQQVETIFSARLTPRTEEFVLSSRAGELVKESWKEASALDETHIAAEHLLLGLVGLSGKDPQAGAARVLAGLGLDLEAVRQSVLWRIRSKGRAGAARSALLGQYGRNLTLTARRNRLGPLFDRDLEIDAVVRALSRRAGSGLALVGSPGVGKTSVVRGLAKRISSGAVPASLADVQIYAMDMSILLSGSDGELEYGLAEMLAEACNHDDVILVADDLPALLGNEDAEGMLAPLLAGDRLRLIGEISPGAHRRLTERQEIMRHFATVTVPEPSLEVTVSILTTLREAMQARHKVSITDAAITAAAESAQLRMRARHLPEKAVWVLDAAAYRVRAERSAESPRLGGFRERIAEARRAKDDAVARQDFEAAARLRNDEETLSGAMAEHEDDWDTAQADARTVTAEDVAAALAPLLSPMSLRKADRPAPVEHDPEVWLLS